MFAPRLVIVPRRIPESAENAFKVMFVLKSNMLLNQCGTTRGSVFRKRCACQRHLLLGHRGDAQPQYYHRTDEFLAVESVRPSADKQTVSLALTGSYQWELPLSTLLCAVLWPAVSTR